MSYPPATVELQERKVTMALMYITSEAFDRLSDIDYKVCVYCDRAVEGMACRSCGEYKGLMSVTEWESYTGEVWDE